MLAGTIGWQGRAYEARDAEGPPEYESDDDRVGWVGVHRVAVLTGTRVRTASGPATGTWTIVVFDRCGGVRVESPSGGRSLLRRLPQQEAQDGGLAVGRSRSRQSRPGCRGLGKGRAEAPHGHDAASQRAAAFD